MSKDREQGYAEGRRRTLINILSYALIELGGYGEQPIDSALTQLARLVQEREETVQALREFCQTGGDNEWEDNLHLADVVSKHLDTEPYCDVCGNAGKDLRTDVDVCHDCYSVVSQNYMGLGESANFKTGAESVIAWLRSSDENFRMTGNEFADMFEKHEVKRVG